jgi:hypothetical protein
MKVYEFDPKWKVSLIQPPAPWLALLRKKFDSRPIFVRGALAQKAGPIDLVIG